MSDIAKIREALLNLLGLFDLLLARDDLPPQIRQALVYRGRVKAHEALSLLQAEKKI